MNELFPEPEPESDIGNNKEYKVEPIIDNIVYVKEAERHLPSLYYLISWKNYLEKESTWELSSTVMYFWKIIFMFYKNYSEKPTVTCPILNFVLSHGQAISQAYQALYKAKVRPSNRLSKISQKIKYWTMSFFLSLS